MRGILRHRFPMDQNPVVAVVQIVIEYNIADIREVWPDDQSAILALVEHVVIDVAIGDGRRCSSRNPGPSYSRCLVAPASDQPKPVYAQVLL